MRLTRMRIENHERFICTRTRYKARRRRWVLFVWKHQDIIRKRYQETVEVITVFGNVVITTQCVREYLKRMAVARNKIEYCKTREEVMGYEGNVERE